MTRLALAVAVLSACAPRSWEPPAYAATSALIACDYGQTVAISNGGRWDRAEPGYRFREVDPLLGSAPSLGTMTIGVLAALAANAVMWRLDAPS